MIQTAEHGIRETANPGDKDFEIEFGQDSIMTVRISYGARASITPEKTAQDRCKRGKGKAADRGEETAYPCGAKGMGHLPATARG